MWDEDPDIFDEMDEQEIEHESGEDFADFALDSDMGEFNEAEALDEYSSYFDYEG